MNIIAVKAKERHEMFCLGEQTEPLLGHTWLKVGCPICGYTIQICYETGRHISGDPGDNALTDDDWQRVTELMKAGRTEEAKALMASEPGHYYNGGIQITGIEMKNG